MEGEICTGDGVPETGVRDWGGLMTDYTNAPPGIVQSDTVDLDDGRTRCAWELENDIRCRKRATHQFLVGRMWLGFCPSHPRRGWADGYTERAIPERENRKDERGKLIVW